jgi:cell wall assembly regulator SMI1
MDQILEELGRAFKKHNPKDAKLRPGVSDASLDAFEKKYALRLPPTLRVLYKWSDGSDAQEAFAGGWTWCSLAEAGENLERYRKTTKDSKDTTDPEWYHPDWFPLMIESSDGHVVDCKGTLGGKAGQVVSFFHEEGGHVSWDSLGRFFDTILAVVKDGEWKDSDTLSELQNQDNWDFDDDDEYE